MADELFGEVEDVKTVDVKAELVSGPPMTASTTAQKLGVTPVQNAAPSTDKHFVALGGTFTLHTVSNGFIAKAGSRAYGLRTDDFEQLQKLMTTGEAPEYSGQQPPWESGANNQLKHGALPAPDILSACKGLVIIHQLENCCLVAGTNGLYLAETPVEAMKELDKIFKRL